MSGDSAEGTSTFTMNGGTINSKSGHVFHVTNTSAVINLNGITINNEDSSGVLLSVSDDGWSGASNIATLNASGQSLSGNILVGSNSTLSLNLTNGATFSGNLSGNVTNASGSVVSSSIGTVNLTLDDASKLYLSGDTYVTSFSGNATNVITNGYNFYVNNSVLDGTTTQENTVPSALAVDAEQSLVSASSTFSGTINLNELSNVKNANASATSNNVIIIGNSYDNSIIGGSGADSMTGGGGNNSLIGGAARDQFWLMGEGNAIATDFVAGNGDDSDVITFYNVELSGISRAGSQLNFTATNGSVLNLQTSSDDGNGVFLYSLDGNNIAGAKVGNDSDNSLTDDSSANYYYLPNDGGTIYVYGDGRNDTWLDNSVGKYYFGITNITANNAGENILAGNNYNNVIIGGSGSNSMWGGGGSEDDTLQGGDGYNMFWYGQGEGNDVVTNAKESDVVNLYDINLSQITSAQVDGEKISFTVDNGNVLNVYNSSSVTPTFKLASGEKYNYNRESSAWQQV